MFFNIDLTINNHSPFSIGITIKMNVRQRVTIVWAARRVNYLDVAKRYEDSYAVSQESSEWTTCLNVYLEGLEYATINVPDFDMGNRTS